VEHRDPGPDSEARPVLALRALLNSWDPIGVVGHGAPPDEYDCMIAPVLDLLESGADADGIARFLRDELEEHFGSDPERRAAGIASVSSRMAALRPRHR
jgi:hypothetical protein